MTIFSKRIQRFVPSPSVYVAGRKFQKITERKSKKLKEIKKLKKPTKA